MIFNLRTIINKTAPSPTKTFKSREYKDALTKQRRMPGACLLDPIATEDGFVLIAAMMALLVLVILGISSITSTNIELQIAGNDKISKQAFYAADGGTEVGANLLEENVSCPEGFAAQPLSIGSVEVVDKIFWTQETVALPSDTVRDIRFPANDAAPHTNVTISGNTVLNHGSALQMIAGYEGMGKGAASGGSLIMFDIYAQRLEMNNATSTVYLLWRHAIGLEGECKY